MTEEEHKELHKQLHASLDTLLADFIGQTKKQLKNTNILELLVWSYEQTINPTFIGENK
jgi:hypothetical protein